MIATGKGSPKRNGSFRSATWWAVALWALAGSIPFVAFNLWVWYFRDHPDGGVFMPPALQEATGSITVALLAPILALPTVYLSLKAHQTNHRGARAAEGQLEAARQADMNRRFQDSARLLGDASSAMRIAGVESLKALIDEWMITYHHSSGTEQMHAYSQVQQCLNLLTAALPSVEVLNIDRGGDAVVQDRVAEILMQIFTRENDLAALLRLNLKGLRLSGTRSLHFHAVDANFAGADLSGVDFSGSTLPGADFSGSDLTGCKFDDADLTEASLRLATVAEGSFVKTNLQNAALQGADFTNVYLAGAKLSGAQFGFQGTKSRSENRAYGSRTKITEAQAIETDPPLDADQRKALRLSEIELD